MSEFFTDDVEWFMGDDRLEISKNKCKNCDKCKHELILALREITKLHMELKKHLLIEKLRLEREQNVCLSPDYSLEGRISNEDYSFFGS